MCKYLVAVRLGQHTLNRAKDQIVGLRLVTAQLHRRVTQTRTVLNQQPQRTDFKVFMYVR